MRAQQPLAHSVPCSANDQASHADPAGTGVDTDVVAAGKAAAISVSRAGLDVVSAIAAKLGRTAYAATAFESDAAAALALGAGGTGDETSRAERGISGVDADMASSCEAAAVCVPCAASEIDRTTTTSTGSACAAGHATAAGGAAAIRSSAARSASSRAAGSGPESSDSASPGAASTGTEGAGAAGATSSRTAHGTECAGATGSGAARSIVPSLYLAGAAGNHHPSQREANGGRCLFPLQSISPYPA